MIKRKINRRVQKRLDMVQFHHFGTVFENLYFTRMNTFGSKTNGNNKLTNLTNLTVKEDHETGKLVQKQCLFTRQSQRMRLSRNSRALVRQNRRRD